MSVPWHESVTKPRGEDDLDIDPEWTARILCGFVSKELRRTGLERVVVGLSGGIDSALSCALAARALGPRGVLAVRMPYRTSDPTSLTDAQALIDRLGIESETVEITPGVEGFLESCAEPEPSRLRLGNVMARMRMLTLFDRSARHRALVLGSSNKTEILLGYGTIYGDLASAINPIGDLYKTQVRSLARHLGVPETILTKAPSADLWPGQSDEDDLGTDYETLDRLLVLLVDSRVRRETVIAAGFPPALVDETTRRIVRSQFKRKMPVIAKVSTRTVGRDFRYPRDWQT